MRAFASTVATMLLVGLCVCPAPSEAPLAPAIFAVAPGAMVPARDDKVLFTFAIFGDNKSGGPWLDVVFNNMRAIRPSFVIGMGDHYQGKGSRESFDRSVGEAFGHRHFWPTQGDNEDEYWGGAQSLFKSQNKYFVRIGMFDAKGKPKRKEIKDSNPEMMDYYAQLHVAGMTVHLVSLYDHDSMDLQRSSKAWADHVLPAIKKNKKPTEPWIVMAHDGMWWLASFKRGHAIYSCDLLMGASWHQYAFFGNQHEGTNLAFNTSAVGRGSDSWYAVMAFKDKFVLLNMDPRAFKVKGTPGCFIKPFGKPGYPGAPAPWLLLMAKYGKSVRGRWGPSPKAPPVRK